MHFHLTCLFSDSFLVIITSVNLACCSGRLNCISQIVGGHWKSLCILKKVIE
uniref:Uncharacterized protein n=1 Tax=Rhizophora mucronata TaxID=61149 RepID=A0A2P2Q3L2_RHIMU